MAPAIHVGVRSRVSKREKRPLVDFLEADAVRLHALGVLAWCLQHNPQPWGDSPGPSFFIVRKPDDDQHLVVVVEPAAWLNERPPAEQAGVRAVLARVDVDVGHAITVYDPAGSPCPISRVRYYSPAKSMHEAAEGAMQRGAFALIGTKLGATVTYKISLQAFRYTYVA